MKLEYIKKENIANTDILDNINDKTIAILLHVDDTKTNWWIEINPDYSLFVPNGWDGFKTDSICKAVEYLQELKTVLI